MKNTKKEKTSIKKLHLLLVYPDYIESDADKKHSGGSYSEGLASISAVVKAGGHKVSLMHLTDQPTKDEFIKKLKLFKDIDLIGFSTRTTAFDDVVLMCEWTKSIYPKLFTFCGGYHAILLPESFMEVDNIDAVCVGEGEYPILELMNKMANKENYDKILSFYFKKGNKIIKNPVRPLIEDLDELPFPDIDLFDYKNLDSTRVNQALIMLSRGCIYSCTYCGNSGFRNIYPNKLKYARFRSPEKAIELIKNVLTKYPNIKIINFRDAIFNMFTGWFDEFIELYTKEIHLPFTCNLRFDIVTEDTVRRMKEAGCYTIDIGLESGNEEIRRKYLHRYTTDEQMINCSKWFTKYKIKVMTYNIIGLPYEDIHKALETIKLNAKLKSDRVVPNIFYPYPMTELHRISEEGGFLRNITPKTKVFIKQPQFPDYQVLYIVNYFHHFVKKYKWCYKKNTKFRHMMEKYYDFVVTGPITPRRLLNLFANIKNGCEAGLKRLLLNKMPKFYSFLRNKKHGLSNDKKRN